jgi:hypothetical protein
VGQRSVRTPGRRWCCRCRRRRERTGDAIAGNWQRAELSNSTVQIRWFVKSKVYLAGIGGAGGGRLIKRTEADVPLKPSRQK